MSRLVDDMEEWLRTEIIGGWIDKTGRSVIDPEALAEKARIQFPAATEDLIAAAFSNVARSLRAEAQEHIEHAEELQTHLRRRRFTVIGGDRSNG